MSKKKGFSHHHILFQRKQYSTGYAHQLRSEKYLIVQIPHKLHATIHSEVHGVPTPDGADCKRALQALQQGITDGTLTNQDTLMQRLNFLIGIWEETCPATTIILQWCHDVAEKYYSARPSNTPQNEDENETANQNENYDDS